VTLTVRRYPVGDDNGRVRGGQASVSSGERDVHHSALKVFAGEMRHFRARCGLSQDELSSKIAYSSSLVAMVESCRRIPSLDFAKRCDEAMETGGVLVRFHPLVAGEAYPSWFRPFVELERTATYLRTWEPVLVPGLLQTEGYARAILRVSRPRDSAEQIDELVAARIARQEIFTQEMPPELWAIIDESALRRNVGEQGVMAEQIDRLVVAARSQWVTIQIMPLTAATHPGLLGPFVVAALDSAPDIAYLDNALSGQVVERPEDVSRIARLYDTLRAEALPPRASTALLTEVSQWT
jgi:transcriptional regulator with XRE-family HTH domain